MRSTAQLNSLQCYILQNVGNHGLPSSSVPSSSKELLTYYSTPCHFHQSIHVSYAWSSSFFPSLYLSTQSNSPVLLSSLHGRRASIFFFSPSSSTLTTLLSYQALLYSSLLPFIGFSSLYSSSTAPSSPVSSDLTEFNSPHRITMLTRYGFYQIFSCFY